MTKPTPSESREELEQYVSDLIEGVVHWATMFYAEELTAQAKHEGHQHAGNSKSASAITERQGGLDNGR